ncbi:MAG: bifunctional phosphoribosyl-AMP cyclohydrolase/phosphoribosyl-ATP diphosphatase HisIE [Clostridiaceae bacterium]|nr:bifunctional phosphoribosyl-AMP cyclohydrolase/phosphoribosyl-ATP diphosphatase HisIE [Clostridiaceae bacterium]
MIDMEYNLKLNEAGLIPVIVTDAKTGEVLMLAWMNKEALDKTVETKKAHYYSRSRQAIWMKGETSGNVQTVVSIKKDCDGDTLLMAVEQEGAACHTGERSCFYSDLFDENTKTESSELYGAAVLKEVYRVVTDRKKNPKEGSYTNYLFDKGIDKILKKVGEEASEVIIAAKNNSKDEIRYETADLLYHLIVMLVDRGLTLEEIYGELKKRR